MEILFFILLVFVCWEIYLYIYFKSDKFTSIKNRVSTYVKDCNDLNNHIESLKNTYLGINQLDYGTAEYKDKSTWNYKRPELKKQKYEPNIYNCSRNVCDNARKQPFKYICKYFDIDATEQTLSQFENVLNNFEAVGQGKILLKSEKNTILNSIKKDTNFLVRLISKNRLENELGFEEIDFTTSYFPEFIFKYISSGGNASMQCKVIMNIDNLNRFVNYLSEKVKFKKSSSGQRALMTSSLRKEIMKRDNYTCKICGISTYDEPHLLLEIDHIVPISKGGLTTKDNLQTLCWKCNRTKGAKM